jgi:tripartite-type tricarboxylate transporter receptor subunit TctC
MHISNERARFLRVAVAVCLLLTPGFALAQTYPAKTIRLVVPSSPGGGTDIVGRVLAQKLSGSIGQQVVVENRAGAGTMIGNELVAKSPPDGYTLLMGLSTLAIIPAMYETVRYDALRDFAPVSHVVTVPNVLLVHPSVPAKSVKELIELAKSRRVEMIAGSAGTGTSPHLSLELFRSMARIEVVHVPYKGSGQSIVGLLSGEIALMFAAVPTAMPHLKTSRVRALGVTTARPSEALPDIPTIAAAGLPGYEATQWFGVLAPAGTPRPIIDRLHREITSALRASDVKQHLAAEGAEIVASTPEQFGDYLTSETAKWARVIKAAGIKPQ